MNTDSKSIVLLFLCFTAIIAFIGCAALGTAPWSPKLAVSPEKTVLSPALIKDPIVFSGSGWKPNEMVVVNLIVPEGVKVKEVGEGEDVGIAAGTADADGNLSAKVGAITVLMTLFQTGWDDNTMKPDFKQATPLPPGTYEIQAIGLESATAAKTKLTFLPPPKKE
jgi:hypothetical protein